MYKQRGDMYITYSQRFEHMTNSNVDSIIKVVEIINK